MPKTELFHVIDDAQAILLSGGVYKQVKVYRRGKQIFAAHGGGFVRLFGYNGTSHPRVSWREIDTGGNDKLVVEGNKEPTWK